LIFILQEVVKGSLIVLLIYIISFALEKITGLNLLIWNLRQKSNYNMAQGAANIAAIIYFIVNFIVLQVDLDLLEKKPQGYSFILWLIIILPITIIFRMLHLHLTPIEKDRDDFDFSE
jgi:hypothetical protein